VIVWLLAALAAVARPPADAQSIDGVPESHFLEQRERFTPQGGTPVDLRFLITPEASGQTTRLVDATHAAISLLSDWFGPLASSSLTVAAVPWRGGASIASSAEFAAVPVRWLTPVRDR